MLNDWAYLPVVRLINDGRVSVHPFLLEGVVVALQNGNVARELGAKIALQVEAQTVLGVDFVQDGEPKVVHCVVLGLVAVVRR
jgi:hypothetical protein